MGGIVIVPILSLNILTEFYFQRLYFALNYDIGCEGSISLINICYLRYHYRWLWNFLINIWFNSIYKTCNNQVDIGMVLLLATLIRFIDEAKELKEKNF